MWEDISHDQFLVMQMLSNYFMASLNTFMYVVFLFGHDVIDNFNGTLSNMKYLNPKHCTKFDNVRFFTKHSTIKRL